MTPGDKPGGEVTDPLGPSSGSTRVARGGGWTNSAGYCRAPYRNYGSPGNRYDSFGFRLLKTK